MDECTDAAPRVWLEICLSTLSRNFAAIAAAVDPLRVMVVLKANAYGLGVGPIAKRLADTGAAAIGVAELREALAVNRFGLPVHILGGLLETEVPAVVAHNIVAPITDVAIARALSTEAQRQHRTVQCQFLIDTGMGRLGIAASDAEHVVREVVALPGLQCTGIYSHFPHAYGDREFSYGQVCELRNIVTALAEHGIRFDDIHIANSDGVNNIPESTIAPFTMVRSGINLYGAFDLEGRQAISGLSSVLTLKSRLIAIRELEAGSTVSYGRACTLERTTRVGTVAVGYADGFPLAMSNNGAVWIDDAPCPVLGRVCMDYIIVSLENAPNAAVGDDVVCVGNGTTIADWAHVKATNPYEIICSFGNRVARRYLTADDVTLGHSSTNAR